VELVKPVEEISQAILRDERIVAISKKSEKKPKAILINTGISYEILIVPVI
jgi:hypothetical protein